MNLTFTSYLASKFVFKKPCVFSLASINVSAGPFKTHEVSMEHGHILAVITGAPGSLSTQYHGKRGHTTTSLYCNIPPSQVWGFHDSYINEFLRFAFEYDTPKHFRPKTYLTRAFSGRYREKFRANPHYDMLMESFMWDKHRGKFLPLTVNYVLDRPISNIMSENFIRMIRLPIIRFRRRDRRFFDDRPSDRLRWVLWGYGVINSLVDERILQQDLHLESLIAHYVHKLYGNGRESTTHTQVNLSKHGKYTEYIDPGEF